MLKGLWNRYVQWRRSKLLQSEIPWTCYKCGDRRVTRQLYESDFWGEIHHVMWAERRKIVPKACTNCDDGHYIPAPRLCKIVPFDERYSHSRTLYKEIEQC